MRLLVWTFSTGMLSDCCFLQSGAQPTLECVALPCDMTAVGPGLFMQHSNTARL